MSQIVKSFYPLFLRGQTAHADDAYITDRITALCPGIMLGELFPKSARNGMTSDRSLSHKSTKEKKIAGEEKAGIYMLGMILSCYRLFNL